ncbi:Sensor protein PhoQ [hydrothermal vent metagenome]|uniref:histidine kinase n=1 Tax=hydrothermal vent metagenome TaxID=652676 RepID=A0A3B0Z591_9ZZZZ
MKSLQVRLHVGLGAALTLLMLSLWWLSSSGVNQIGEQMMLSRMEHDGEALLASLQKDESGEWSLKAAHVGHIYQRVFSGHYYLIEVEGQQLRSRSLWDYSLNISTPLQHHQPGPDNQDLLLWYAEFQLNEQSVKIWVAEDITALQNSLNYFSQLFAFACLLMLGGVLLLQRWVVKRSFLSLQPVINELEALSEGDLSSLSTEVPQEVKPLVEEVNRLLHLLAQRLQRSRNAVGNLAHSLKHPLNLLVQLAEQQTADSHLKQELSQHTQQIQQLMERELKRARLAGAGLPGQHFEVADELPTLVELLKRIYQQKALEIHYEIDCGCEYTADRNDMLELLGNLLDNACKWAQQQIVCKISCQQGMVMTIEDDGEGCDSALLFQLTERGVRIDESVQGSGLGLAIVNDIVELYQGEINFQQSTLGGLKVMVRLP